MLKPPYVCGICGKVVPSGERCECRKRKDQERKARYDETRPTARQRGYNTKWDKAREEFLRAHPNCSVPGCKNPATVVDHIIPHKGNLKLFWDRKNWQPLCTSHHCSLKQSQDRRNSGGNNA